MPTPNLLGIDENENENENPKFVSNKKYAQLESIIEDLRFESSNWIDSNHLVKFGDLTQNLDMVTIPNQVMPKGSSNISV